MTRAQHAPVVLEVSRVQKRGNDKSTTLNSSIPLKVPWSPQLEPKEVREDERGCRAGSCCSSCVTNTTQQVGGLCSSVPPLWVNQDLCSAPVALTSLGWMEKETCGCTEKA